MPKFDFLAVVFKNIYSGTVKIVSYRFSRDTFRCLKSLAIGVIFFGLFDPE